MEPVKYVGQDVNDYIMDIEKYRLKLQNDSYNLILEYVNELMQMKKKYKSLTEFKFIDEKNILKDQTHCHKIVRSYSQKLEKQLKITLSVDEETDSDDIKDKYPIQILKDTLKAIGYKLINKTSGSNIVYTIKFARI